VILQVNREGATAETASAFILVEGCRNRITRPEALLPFTVARLCG